MYSPSYTVAAIVIINDAEYSPAGWSDTSPSVALAVISWSALCAESMVVLNVLLARPSNTYSVVIGLALSDN